MSSGAVKILGLFAYIFFMYVVASLIFTEGFLLKRDVIDRNSSCHVDFAEYQTEHVHGASGCWLHRRFDKAIIIVVDALRFDFIVPHDDSFVDVPYLNKLKTVHELLDRKPKNSKLYKFVADPPTTTMQRLKGLTTGSLPTFVDAGSNFATTEITEDNVIDQAVKNGKKVTFMGDDTWMGLFPGRFERAFPYPSFNVKDLHTVDNGVLDHLYEELARPDWDITIAHFLGVDHVGHRYGPNHPAMADKLTQMDQVIRNVTSKMDDKTVLFVFGDHGMTSTGDHGGDSQDELDAGLFVYSPKQIVTTPAHDTAKYQTVAQIDVVPTLSLLLGLPIPFSNLGAIFTDIISQAKYQTVAQIDVVPTLSLLLGLPIPFSNLGAIITDLFGYCSWSKDSHIKEVFHVVEAVRLNARQVSEYIGSYSEQSGGDLPTARLGLLQQFLRDTDQQLQDLMTELYLHNFAENTHGKLHQLEGQYTQFVSEVKEICRGMWAKFDMVSIFLGILAFAVTVLVNIYVLCVHESIAEGKGMGMVAIVVGTSAVFVVYCVIQMLFLEGSAVSMMAFILGLFDFVAIAIIIQIVRTSKESQEKSAKKASFWRQKLNIETIASVLAVVISMCCFFSNSFVVYEDSISLFCTQSLVWVLCFKTVRAMLKDGKPVKEHFKMKSKSGNKGYDFFRYLSQPTVLVVMLALGCSSGLRFAADLGSCREEQVNCTTSWLHEPLSSLGQTVEGSKNVRYFSCVGCLFAAVYAMRRWMSHHGNLNGWSPAVLCARYLLPAGAAATALHWAIQGLPAQVLDALPVWQQVSLARCVYVAVAVSLLALVVGPLTTYTVPRPVNQLSVPGECNEDETIRHVYNHVKAGWEEGSGSKETDSQPPVVYGLATAFTATVVYTGMICVVLLSLLLGDGLAPSLLAAVFSLFLFLELFSAAVRVCRDSDILPLGIVTLVTMTTSFFYALGHHATIPAIRFEAAFVGFHGEWENQVVPAALIYINMFASELFFTLMSCLLVLWPCIKGLFTGWLFGKKGQEEGPWRGDYVMFENPGTFRALLVRLLATMYLVNSLKLLSSMLAATLHRRHLMVWKIFAPRFVFQGVASFTVYGALLLMMLVLFRVERALKNWSEKLTRN